MLEEVRQWFETPTEERVYIENDTKPDMDINRVEADNANAWIRLTMSISILIGN